jgi:ABC-type glycerol-3-phosphate transport system substrate-binding protein
LAGGRIALALALIACLALASACTGGGAASTTAATTAAATTVAAATSAAETTAAAEPGAKVKLKIYDVPQDDDPESAHQEFAFTKEKAEAKFPNVEFEWTHFAPGSDYRQQYDQQLMSGDGPTVAHTFPYVDIQTRIANNTIADITEYVADWDLRSRGLVNSTFDEALSTPDGKWFAVPYAPYVNAIVYNSAVIKEAGGDPDKIPATWTEFAEMASAYTDKDLPRFGYLLLGSEWNAWTFTPWVWAAGGEMVRPNGDGTWQPAFQEDPGVDAAMYMNELIWARNATQKDVLESYDDMQNHFKAGQAAYGWGSPPGFSADDLAKFDQKQEDIGFFPLPAKDDGGRVVGFAGGEVWTMLPSATKEQRDAAWEYIQYISFDEEYLTELWALQDSLGRLTANPTVRNDLVEKKFSMASSWPAHWAKQMADAMAVAQPEPYCPNWNELKNEIVQPLQTIYLTEGISRDEAKRLLEECAETLYVKYPDAFVKK